MYSTQFQNDTGNVQAAEHCVIYQVQHKANLNEG